MGLVRLLAGVTIAALSLVATACSTGDIAPEAATTESSVSEPTRVPDPPPRYAHADYGDAGIDFGDGGKTTLQIKCGGYEPYVCPLEDGTFKCSDRPCLPDCTRVGCLSGESCLACDGGHRCVANDRGGC